MDFGILLQENFNFNPKAKEKVIVRVYAKDKSYESPYTLMVDSRNELQLNKPF